ncbi:MAG: NAD kinase [Bacteroidota bacterium]
MKIAIYGRAFNPKTLGKVIQSLFLKLENSRVDVLVYEPFVKHLEGLVKVDKKNIFVSHQDIKGKVEFLFSIGGDGTLLETITLVRDSNIPIIGINTGRLGFLSDVSQEEVELVVDAVINKKYSLDKRILLELETKQKVFGEENFALNDISVQKKDSSSMITIHTYLDEKFLNSYWADGLIVASPTGSTAYSLSCGGPIVMPNSDNFIITPIAPHNLNVRPIIISSDESIMLKVNSRSAGFLVSLDSRFATVPTSVELIIKKADFCISLIKLENYNFLSTIRNKLMWGMDRRN